MNVQRLRFKQLFSRLLKLILICLSLNKLGYAWSWSQLWVTPDQQAQALMNQGKFIEANALFQQQNWQAAAAYRAGNFAEAAKRYEATRDYYNLGNALAHLHQYKQAIQAYDRALAENPQNQDAKHNRQLIKAHLKKQKNTAKESKNKSNKEKSEKKQGNKNQPHQDESGKDESNEGQAKTGQSKKNQSSKSQFDQSAVDKNKEARKQQGNQHHIDKDHQERNPVSKGQKSSEGTKEIKHEEKNQSPSPKTPKKERAPVDQSAINGQASREEQKEKEQLLQLIPDDPGGLMREKFLRDHLRRSREE